MILIAALALLLPFNPMAFNNASSSEPGQAPDAIFVNADIYTQTTPARVQALAVRDGRVIAIGSSDEIRKLKGSRTQVVDLGGHFVMPGFNDAHCHLASGGFEQMNVNLAGTHKQRRTWRLDHWPRLGPHPVVGSEIARPAGPG